MTLPEKERGVFLPSNYQHVFGLDCSWHICLQLAFTPSTGQTGETPVEETKAFFLRLRYFCSIKASIYKTHDFYTLNCCLPSGSTLYCLSVTYSGILCSRREKSRSAANSTLKENTLLLFFLLSLRTSCWFPGFPEMLSLYFLIVPAPYRSHCSVLLVLGLSSDRPFSCCSQYPLALGTLGSQSCRAWMTYLRIKMPVMAKKCHFENKHLCFVSACLLAINALAKPQWLYFTRRTLSVDNYAVLLTSLPF